MAKIQIGGAGGAPSNNFIRSMRESSRNDYLIGTSCVPSDLFLADVDEKYVVPLATATEYAEKLTRLLTRAKPDFLHVQNDYEVQAVSRLREQIRTLGVRLYLPASETVENCIDKNKSYELWKKAGVRVPATMLLDSPDDLKKAFAKLGEKIWIRATVGAAGQGALPADNYDFARIWIDRFSYTN